MYVYIFYLFIYIYISLITLIVIIVINILFDTITIDILMQVREKVGKSQNTEIFQWLVAPGGRKVVSKSRFAKAACAEPSGQMRYEKLHAVVARSACGSQKCEKLTGSEHFWKLRCRKVHAVVARSAFRIQNVQNTSASRHCWKLRCRKSARRSGPKHMSISKVEKTWVWSTFGRSDTVSRGRRKGLCTLSKVSKTRRFCSRTNYNHYTTPTPAPTTTTTLQNTTRHNMTRHDTTLH